MELMKEMARNRVRGGGRGRGMELVGQRGIGMGGWVAWL